MIRSARAALVEARLRWGSSAGISSKPAWWTSEGKRYYPRRRVKDTTVIPDDATLVRAPEFAVGKIVTLPGLLSVFEILGSGRSWDDAFSEADRSDRGSRMYEASGGGR